MKTRLNVLLTVGLATGLLMATLGAKPDKLVEPDVANIPLMKISKADINWDGQPFKFEGGQRVFFNFSPLKDLEAYSLILEAKLAKDSGFVVMGMGVVSDDKKSLVGYRGVIGENDPKYCARHILVNDDERTERLKIRDYIVRVVVRPEKDAQRLDPNAITCVAYYLPDGLTWHDFDHVKVYADEDEHEWDDTLTLFDVPHVSGFNSWPGCRGAVPWAYCVGCDQSHHDDTVAALRETIPSGELHDRPIYVITIGEELRRALMPFGGKGWSAESKEFFRHEKNRTLIRYGYDPDDPNKPWKEQALKEYDSMQAYAWMNAESENPDPERLARIREEESKIPTLSLPGPIK